MSLIFDMSQRDHGDAVWKALADPRRRAILDFVADGRRTTGDIVDRFDSLCRTAVMKHMDILEAAGLLLVRREGRTRWNYLNPVPIQRVCDRWIRRHIQHRASSLSRLKDVVEAGAEKKNEK